MKLPDTLTHLFHQEGKPQKAFLSLILDEDHVAAAVWVVNQDRTLDVKHIEEEPVSSNSWDEKTQSSDRAIVRLEQKEPNRQLRDVVLGLPLEYLTETGDIDPHTRPHIKKLTSALDLVPIGFVSIHQAIIHKLKTDEGVPPSVILIHISGDTVTLFLYKVGALVGMKKTSWTDIAATIEDILKNFKDMEVLPSRMLLYGNNRGLLDQVKQSLLKHPWPTRANFMHFPKIELLPQVGPIEAVCLAGASEMAAVIGEEEMENGKWKMENGNQEQIEEETNEEVIAKEEQIEEPEEEPNVVMVEPEKLGFKKNIDILEEEFQSSKEEQEETKQKKKPKISFPISLPKISLPSFSNFTLSLPKVPFDRFSNWPLVAGVVGLLVLVWLVYWFVPRTKVTILEIPKFLDETAALTVDPTATIADSNTKIIPGKKQEQSVSGEKTIPVAGKKQVGDPAKGTVTIYNKSLSSRIFHKGDILAAGSVQFNLDSDVSVASASESIGSITFGKASGAVTAVVIGTQGNLPSATEFTFQNVSSSVAIARNDQPLAGGNSRDVTVVARADYDSLVKDLTDELVTKAKSDLEQGVGGGEKLIDDTVKATVTQKQFSQELNQEAKELHGNITITVSGISYKESDVVSILKGAVESKIPNGYTFSERESTTQVQSVQVKKDGTILLTVKFHGAALPSFSANDIQKALAGKSIEGASDYLKRISGVGGVEYIFSWSLTKNRLPINKNNITVTVSLQQ